LRNREKIGGDCAAAHAESAARFTLLIETLYHPNLRAGANFAVAHACLESSNVAEENVVKRLAESERR